MKHDIEDADFPLGIPGFRFSDLYQPLRLRALHDAFWEFAESRAEGLQNRFLSPPGGRDPDWASLSPPQQSEILIAVAEQLEAFLTKLFRIEEAAARLRSETDDISTAFRFKQEFLRTRLPKSFSGPALSDGEFAALHDEVQRGIAASPPHADPEIRFARHVLSLLDAAGRGEAEAAAALDRIAAWCVEVSFVEERRRHVAGWAAFVRPHKLDYERLVQLESPREDLPEARCGPAEHRRLRDGFTLTDPRMNRKEYLREMDYCIICHPREKDSCSKGFFDKSGRLQKNPLGIPLTGCPLDERISEMHDLRRRGFAVASLAMVMLDNPMCPGTGHRICNDCMKGCIFQKQDPVNIPQAETGVVSDVLGLPYGFEIYSLLTRFNPLNRRRPYALPYHGADALVVGLGPAGYTLAHYLANEGFGVVGIDGLKLEPVPDELTGRGRAFPRPIRDVEVLKAALDERILMGFGGVSEYGITVRWDKTFLAVIYLTLLRRANTRFYGGVRFGGTLNLDDAWERGFRHVALATGAGRPTVISMKNNLIRGIRKASDLLMALQLTGAFKRSSLANLQVRLPALVIGGGLTAIDTATELLAYYPIQVEKILAQHERLCDEHGEAAVRGMCSPEEQQILETFLAHGRAVRAERERARSAGEQPDLVSLCRSWGGVAIAYRKGLVDSPAYRLNHEEVAKALEEGIEFIEGLTPVEAVPDEFGHVAAMKFKRANGQLCELPARTVCVAAGTTPNIVYGREFPGTIELAADGKYFRKHRLVEQEGLGGGWGLEPCDEPSTEAFFLSYQNDGRFVSFYGDGHPDYAGNVVKAMASAKHGAVQLARLFAPEIAAAEAVAAREARVAAREAQAAMTRFERLVARLDDELVPRVDVVRRLTPTIVEVVVRAPQAARKFQPGQFFRLQNYESLAPLVDGVRLTMEGIALTGAWVDVERGLLSMIVLEMGASSRLCAALRPGEPVVVMGPTGAPSEIPEGETVLLVGGGLGNAVLFSIGKELRARGSRVLYFAGYRSRVDLFMQEAIEQATDQVVWSVDYGELIPPRRPQDLTFRGNIVQALAAYARGELRADAPGPPRIELGDVDRILAIGSDRMMAAVAEARHGVLQPYLKPGHVGLASINSPMQCMMKEVCGQCLQKHVDPQTRQECDPVFSCFNQDQPMDAVDFGNLRQRLLANSLQEKLSSRTLDRLLRDGGIARV